MQFGDFERFSIEAEATNVGPQLLSQLQAIFSDPERLINLKLELAITIDVGGHFVKATYFLPGGGTFGISGWECATGTLEPLAYTRASSAKFCYPLLELTPQITPNLD